RSTGISEMTKGRLEALSASVQASEARSRGENKVDSRQMARWCRRSGRSPWMMASLMCMPRETSSLARWACQGGQVEARAAPCERLGRMRRDARAEEGG